MPACQQGRGCRAGYGNDCVPNGIVQRATHSSRAAKQNNCCHCSLHPIRLQNVYWNYSMIRLRMPHIGGYGRDGDSYLCGGLPQGHIVFLELSCIDYLAWL